MTFVVSPYAASEQESINSTAYSSKYSGIISTVTPYNAYKDGKNFVFANSTINESITAVEWGSSTKEYRTLSRTQTICNINSSYRITSGYILSEQYANRDPETGEWFKKNTLLYLTKQTFSVSYGTMESGESVRAPIKDLFKDGYITSVSGTLEFQSPSSNPINLTCSIKYDNPYQAHLIAKYKPETNFYSSYVVGNIVFKPNISVTYVNSIGGNSQNELLLSPAYELGEGVTTKNVDGVTYLTTNISFAETLIVDLYVGIQQSDDALQSGIGFSKVAVYKV